MNKGFSVYHEYWEAIQHFDESLQKDICLAMMKYGITGELPDPAVNPTSFGMIMAWKLGLDNSIERFNTAESRGNKGGTPGKIDHDTIVQLILENKKAPEIAQILGVSVDAVYKREEWKNRKNLSSKPVETTSKISYDF